MRNHPSILLVPSTAMLASHCCCSIVFLGRRLACTNLEAAALSCERDDLPHSLAAPLPSATRRRRRTTTNPATNLVSPTASNPNCAAHKTCLLHLSSCASQSSGIFESELLWLVMGHIHCSNYFHKLFYISHHYYYTTTEVKKKKVDPIYLTNLIQQHSL